jgi:hypothetical protein
VVVRLLGISDDQLWRVLAPCSRWARAFREWYQRPSISEVRGCELLTEWLSAEQFKQYGSYNYFEVIGCHTGNRYRIRHGTGMNVYELDDVGRPRAGWCFVPNDNLVAGDVMLAQKIALETDERAALAVAKNFSPR